MKSSDQIGFRLRRLALFGFLLATVASQVMFHRAENIVVAQQESSPEKPLDPKAWGGNHVGQPVPEYVHGDECLFCHRNTIGATWQKNAHGVTIRQLEDAASLPELLKEKELAAVAKEVEFFLGSRQRVRFLKKDGYGKFAMLNTQAELNAEGKLKSWIAADKPAWDRSKFTERCAGCHTTGIDAETGAFSAFGLDCYACHGDVTLEHTKDTTLILFAKKRRDNAKVITSICAQCHIRGAGKSNSTGRLWPNNFIGGDNLFQDYNVDFAKADDETLNPVDRHILRNVRDVAVYGKDYPNCTSCHQTHFSTRQQSMAKHKLPPRSPICFDCHHNEASIKGVKPYKVTSGVCEY